ncbi:MAG: TonB-dependent receptor [Deltaproteobacteria bacterium]|nr:TonB-dependent receptor [Deltaproteobacteria bacterium]
MENRFTTNAPKSLPTERIDLQRSPSVLIIGLVFALAILAAPLAGAKEPLRVAQAGEPGAAKSDPPTKREPTATPKPPPNSGIEEIIISGSESEATADFDAADSVTGFGAEDLAALGAHDIADIAAFTPNLEIVTSGATTPTFFIRGVGLNDFNSNSTGAVSIYQDDVARNAPALQLSTLFDVEAVNVLRGPQGTGLARNASAGAIKVYTRKPTGEFNAFLRSELGNFNFMDFEGALEAPIYEDILAARFAFRFSERDGTMKNRCGNAPPFDERAEVPDDIDLFEEGKTNADKPWSICDEPVLQIGAGPFISDIPVGLAPRVNDIGNWAARGTVLFQPTLDMTWLLGAHGSRRDELSRLGQAYGTSGFFCADGDIENCGFFGQSNESKVQNVLGGTQGSGGGGYQAPEVKRRLIELAPCFEGTPGKPLGDCVLAQNREQANDAKIQLAEELARDLDSEPWVGDFNHTGSTTNDTWGGYLKGDLVLPWGMQLTSVTGYDTYDRVIDIDLDFSPETLFQIRTDDDGWQVTQDLRLQGQLGDDSVLRWDIGGWFMREQLDVVVQNDLGRNTNFAIGERSYTQDLWSAAGYASLAFDFWDDFTLDGGFRYNWEQKKLDYSLTTGTISEPLVQQLDEVWQAPTGTIRLTYRFRDDTHAFWKYTRGWKPVLQLHGLPALHRAAVCGWPAGVRDPQRRPSPSVRRRGRCRGPPVERSIRERPLRLAREQVPRLRPDPAGHRHSESSTDRRQSRAPEHRQSAAQLPQIQGQHDRRADASARALGRHHCSLRWGVDRHDLLRRHGGTWNSEREEHRIPAGGHHRAACLLAAQPAALLPATRRPIRTGRLGAKPDESVLQDLRLRRQHLQQHHHLLRGRSANLRRHADHQLVRRKPHRSLAVTRPDSPARAAG